MPDLPVWVVVQTHFPGRSNWYVRMTWPEGGSLHGDPWNSWEAANHAMKLARRDWLMRLGKTGNGDTCPLVPEHGAMWALTPLPGRAPMQWCPNASHDGGGWVDNEKQKRNLESRSIWPLHGFEESVKAYMARQGREVNDGNDT